MSINTVVQAALWVCLSLKQPTATAWAWYFLSRPTEKKKRKRKERRGRSWPALTSRLLFICFYNKWNQLPEWKVKSELNLACVTVAIWQLLPCPIGLLWLLCAGRVCLLFNWCVSALLLYVHIVCVWVVGGGSSIHERDILLSRHFPLCFHSDLVGDWWLNCGVHVNSNWWFMKILRVSEAAQAGGEEKDIAF